ncbi:MAG: hypothetical protein LH702_09830, partial [Phormidesmis sp. CAN_BIN44]|nr:hypothetical protein [Phormidesmis sp. CAN_BIN44]
MVNTRNTDTVGATWQGKRLVRDSIRNRLSIERQKLIEANSAQTYSEEDLAEEAKLSIDTLKRFKGGTNVKRGSAEAIA